MIWDEFISVVAEFTELPVESIENLGLDSLALTELLITLIEDHGVDALTEDLFERSWERVTLAALFEKYCNGKPSPSAGRLDGTPEETIGR
jgi:acyl carrier protein